MTPAGKSEQIAKLNEEIVATLTRADKSAELKTKITTMKADLAQRAKKQREQNRKTGDDPVISFLKAQEVRRLLLDARDQARRDHDMMLAQAKATGKVLSDQQKQFQDPIAALYTEAVDAYARDKEILLASIQEAPLPLLTDEIIQPALSRLERNLSPELASAIDVQECKKAMYATLWQYVLEVATDPLHQAIQAEQYLARPDGWTPEEEAVQ